MINYHLSQKQEEEITVANKQEIQYLCINSSWQIVIKTPSKYICYLLGIDDVHLSSLLFPLSAGIESHKDK